MTHYRSELTPYSVWRHVASDSLYVFIGVGMCSTNGERDHVEESVIYVSITHQHLCYREIGQFLDGRFEPHFGITTPPA